MKGFYFMNTKKFLSMAIAGALMVSAATAAYANPVTYADDPAYVELTAVADNAKAKREAVSPAELEKLAVPVPSRHWTPPAGETVGRWRCHNPAADRTAPAPPHRKNR